MSYRLQVYVTTLTAPLQTPDTVPLSSLNAYMVWADKDQVIATIPTLPTKKYGHVTDLGYYQKENYRVTFSKGDHCILPGNTRVNLVWVDNPQIVTQAWRTVYQEARLNYVESKAYKLSLRDNSVFRIPDVRTLNGEKHTFYLNGDIITPEEAAGTGQPLVATPYYIEVADLTGASLDATVDTIKWKRLSHQQFSSWVYPIYDRYVRNKRMEWLVRAVYENGTVITYVNNGKELTELQANQLVAQKLLKIWDDEQNLIPNSRNTITTQEFRYRELGQPSLAPLTNKLSRVKEDFNTISQVQDTDGKRGIWKNAINDVIKLLELAIRTFDTADKKVKKL